MAFPLGSYIFEQFVRVAVSISRCTVPTAQQKVVEKSGDQMQSRLSHGKLPWMFFAHHYGHDFDYS